MQQAIRPNVIDLQLSNYTDPVYGATTRLKVAETPKMGASTTLDQITDNTHGPKIHPANIQEVSNIIKDKITDTNFIDGFNNTTHANNCVKTTGYGQSSDIENIICQLRQQYDAAVDNGKKEELFNFIIHLNAEKKANNTNWRFQTYTDPKNARHKVEEYYKQLLGTFVPTVSIQDQKDEINKLLDEIKKPLNRQNDDWTTDQLLGIDDASTEITRDINIRSSYAAYIYNLNQLKSLLKNDLYYNYTVVSKSKPMSKDDIYKFIVNTKNVASRNASAALSTTGTAFSNFGTGLSTMGNSVLNMAKSTTQPPQQQSAVQQVAPSNATQQVATSTAPAPAKSSWWPFGKGGKSKKNKKSHSKKQKKSSRKQQKRRKSSKK
jgi:hypothetical protein